MSGDALPRGAFVPPTDVVGSGAPLQTVETVSLRIGTDRESLQVEQPVSPGIQLRKIMPGSEAAPAFDPAPIETKTFEFPRSHYLFHHAEGYSARNAIGAVCRETGPDQ
ncbi:hypothetical protein ACOJBO_02670 [Rhizobium beringeri]